MFVDILEVQPAEHIVDAEVAVDFIQNRWGNIDQHGMTFQLLRDRVELIQLSAIEHTSLLWNRPIHLGYGLCDSLISGWRGKRG